MFKAGDLVEVQRHGTQVGTFAVIQQVWPDDEFCYELEGYPECVRHREVRLVEALPCTV